MLLYLATCAESGRKTPLPGEEFDSFQQARERAAILLIEKKNEADTVAICTNNPAFPVQVIAYLTLTGTFIHHGDRTSIHSTRFTEWPCVIEWGGSPEQWIEWSRKESARKVEAEAREKRISSASSVVASKPTNDIGNIIGAIIGLPFTGVVLLAWSPIFLLLAIGQLFSTESKGATASRARPLQGGSSSKAISNGTFLLISFCSFIALVFVLIFSRGNVSGPSGSTSSYSTPSVPNNHSGDVWVNGYHRQDGTYVPGHYRSRPDGDPSNNWTNSPNVNPYTGKPGTRQPSTGK